MARIRLLPSLAGAAKRSRAAAAKGRRRAGRHSYGVAGWAAHSYGVAEAAGMWRRRRGRDGSLQQASSHFAGSDFLFAVYRREQFGLHFFWFDHSVAPHHFATFFRPFFLHVFRSLNGVQPFADGAEAKSTGNHSDEFASRQP